MFLLFSAGTYVMYGDKYSLQPQTLRANSGLRFFSSSGFFCFFKIFRAFSLEVKPSAIHFFLTEREICNIMAVWILRWLISEVTIWKTRRHAFVHFPVVWWSFVYTQDQKWLRLFIHPSRACVGSSLINLQKRNIYLAFAVFLYANLS